MLMGGSYYPNDQPTPPWLDLGETMQLSFLAALDITDLYELTNDTIIHNPLWPPVPHKILSDIPNFEGKQGEDMAMHMTTFHL